MEFQEEFERYLAAVRSKRTVETYRNGLLHFNSFLKATGLTVQSLPGSTFDDFVRYLQDKKYKPRSIRTFLASVREFLKWASRKGVRVEHIYQPKTPRVKQVDKYILSKDQLVYVLELARRSLKLAPRTAIAIMACSGLRANELRQILLADITRSASGKVLISVRSEDEDTKENVAKFGKTRIVPLLSFGVPFLIEYLKAGGNRSSRWLFPSPKNTAKPISHRSIFVWTKKISDLTGLPIEPHTFRRSFLSLLHKAGVPEITIQRIAGHSSLSQTSEYIRIDQESIEESIDKVDW